MTYSYTQISQYLTCPRRYRHRYLDGWKEKDTRAAMLFGRAFETALGALFRQEDPGAVLFAEWSACQSQDLHYSNRDSWDRMLRQGLMLLTRFCQDNRVQVHQPQRNLQIKFTRQIAGNNDFVAYIDAIGPSMASAACSSGKPLRADTRKSLRDCCLWIPQLVCYSWITGIAEVAQIVFVRKSLVEVQYLRTTITEEQRQEFGRLVEGTIRRIESADFPAHSGIRFPQNPCSTCPYVGLCLGKQEMIDAAVVRRPGADSLDWLDELNY